MLFIVILAVLLVVLRSLYFKKVENNSFDIGLIISALLSPVIEEVVNRAFLFRFLLDKTKYSIYIWGTVSAIVFSIAHGYDYWIFFISGLFYCFIYYRFGNLLYAILLHFCFNLFRLIFIFQEQQDFIVPADFNTPIRLLIFIICVSFIGIIAWRIYKTSSYSRLNL